jgi:hypothetical protein
MIYIPNVWLRPEPDRKPEGVLVPRLRNPRLRSHHVKIPQAHTEWKKSLPTPKKKKKSPQQIASSGSLSPSLSSPPFSP